MTTRRPVRRSAALSLAALVVSLATACSTATPPSVAVHERPDVAPALSSSADGTTVHVLDLTGVDTAELPSLPSPDTVPTDAASATPVPPPAAVVVPAATVAPAARSSQVPGPQDGQRADPDVLTGRMATTPFSVLGLTWDNTATLDGVVIRYRVRVHGAWTAWQGVQASDVAPDPGTPDASASGSRGGTDPIVAVGADGLQIWAQAEAGAVQHLKAVLVDPGPDRPAAGAATSGSTGVVREASSVRSAAMAQPTILTRADWGADESRRACTPDYSTSMVSAAVHHTASTNDYTAADVPGLIRGFYAFHTTPVAQGGRGWCDIGYNFLVDKFGRIWEGRAGSITTTVIGVHTGGFNSRTVGVAAIGDYSTTAPPAALLEGLSQIIAWKFTVLGILAGTSVTMTSGGGDSKYPVGTVVTFPTIYGHRDAQLTACPGQALYDQLPAIRTRVAQLADATVAASPRGSVDRLTGTLTTVSTGGWAYDRDSTGPVQVAISVDGAVVRVTADGSRPDVAAAFGVGADHGFDAQIPTGNGQHLVCLTALNLGDGHDVQLGCRLVQVLNRDPIGSLDTVAEQSPTALIVGGWALDPDTTAPISVHVYIDGVLASGFTANGSRPDVGAAFGDGDLHGFTQVYPVASGTHTVCVYAINVPAGPNPAIGCRTVSVVNRNPMGSLDTATAASPNAILVGGWALDPDTTAPIDVHTYVDGRLAGAVRADGSRPDVAAAFGDGAQHGFTQVYPATTGTHQVCVYAINVPSGANPAIGCRSVTVVNHDPFGSFDTAVGTSPTSVTVTGWALDPDTTAPIAVHAYVDGRFATAFTATDTRPDVAQLFGMGGEHGFRRVVPTTPGTHQVCLYAINAPTGPNPQIGCKTVTTS